MNSCPLQRPCHHHLRRRSEHCGNSVNIGTSPRIGQNTLYKIQMYLCKASNNRGNMRRWVKWLEATTSVHCGSMQWWHKKLFSPIGTMKNQDLPNEKKKCTNHNKSQSVLERRFNLLEAKKENILSSLYIKRYCDSIIMLSFISNLHFKSRVQSFNCWTEKPSNLKKTIISILHLSVLQDSKIWDG